MKRHWFEVSIKHIEQDLNLSETLGLEFAYDLKYGEYDYSQDLRYMDRPLFETEISNVLNFLGGVDRKGNNVLVGGANSGDELFLFNESLVVALDISKNSLKILKEQHPKAIPVYADIQNIPFPDEYFDIYLAMRTLQSHGINMHMAIKEAFRVLVPGGKAIFSFPNGYSVNGVAVKGMYNVDNKVIDVVRPYILKDTLIKILKPLSHKIYTKEIFSEILVAVVKL